MYQQPSYRIALRSENRCNNICTCNTVNNRAVLVICETDVKTHGCAGMMMFGLLNGTSAAVNH